AHQLRLSDPQLGLAGRAPLGEREGEPVELGDKLRREAVLEFLDGARVDLLEARPALLVEWSGPDLLEQLADHASDPHDLGRLLHHLGDRALTLSRTFCLIAAIGRQARADHDNLRLLL